MACDQAKAIWTLIYRNPWDHGSYLSRVLAAAGFQKNRQLWWGSWELGAGNRTRVETIIEVQVGVQISGNEAMPLWRKENN